MKRSELRKGKGNQTIHCIIVSELIKQLQNVLEKEGDLEIWTYNDEDGYENPLWNNSELPIKRDKKSINNEIVESYICF